MHEHTSRFGICTPLAMQVAPDPALLRDWSMTVTVAVIAAAALLLLVLVKSAIKSAIKIAKEYERGVVFRLGRLMRLRGPGLFVILETETQKWT